MSTTISTAVSTRQVEVEALEELVEVLRRRANSLPEASCWRDRFIEFERPLSRALERRVGRRLRPAAARER